MKEVTFKSLKTKTSLEEVKIPEFMVAVYTPRFIRKKYPKGIVTYKKWVHPLMSRMRACFLFFKENNPQGTLTFVILSDGCRLVDVTTEQELDTLYLHLGLADCLPIIQDKEDAGNQLELIHEELHNNNLLLIYREAMPVLAKVDVLYTGYSLEYPQKAQIEGVGIYILDANHYGVSENGFIVSPVEFPPKIPVEISGVFDERLKHSFSSIGTCTVRGLYYNTIKNEQLAMFFENELRNSMVSNSLIEGGRF